MKGRKKTLKLDRPSHGASSSLRPTVWPALLLLALLPATHLPAQVRPPLSASPNPIPVGSTLTVFSPPVMFPLSAATTIWAAPLPRAGYNVAAVVLCGTAAGAITVAGAASPNLHLCKPTAPAAITVVIPTGPEGDLLLQRGLPAPSGYWNLLAINPGGAQAAFRGQIHFVPAGASPPAPAPAPAAAPYVFGITPACVAQQSGTTVRLTANGQNFDPQAQVFVAYIYFVDNHGTYRTDLNGRDSSLAANIIQSSPTQLTFSIDLQGVHNRGGDSYKLGGNYNVRVRNPDGKESGGPIFFTVQPFSGPGHC